MEKRFDDPTLAENSDFCYPAFCDDINIDKIASTPYFQTYVSAWDRRFGYAPVAYDPQKDAGYDAAPAAIPAIQKKQKSARRLFPVIMVFIFSLLALAVAVLGAINKIDAIAQYVALSGKYANVIELIDCFKDGGATLQGVFSYILPAAMYLSLLFILIAFILSIVALSSRKRIEGLGWLAVVAFLFALLAAVSLFLVLGAPDFGEFISFKGTKSIGYGLIAIAGLELLAWFFSLFAYRKK